MIDNGISSTVTLGNIYTSSYGTSQSIVLNAGSALAGNNVELIGTLNLSGAVPLTIQATNTGGHGTAQDLNGQVVDSGISAGTTA